MRLLGFTLSAIAITVGIQWGVSHLPYGLQHIVDKFTLVLMLVLPVLAITGLARTMRIRNWYVVFVAILSPVVSMILIVWFSLFVLHDPLL